ncbi:MAG: hypothetical protein AAGK21_15965 [Bacteroidota bacterium]
MIRPCLLALTAALALAAAAQPVGPLAAQPSPDDVARDVAAALAFQHGPGAIGVLGDPSLVEQMRAYPDAYRLHIDERLDPVPDASAPDLAAALGLRVGLVQLAAAVGPVLAVPVAERVLQQVMVLVDPVAGAMEATVAAGEMSVDPFEQAAALTDLLYQVSFVLSVDGVPPEDAASAAGSLLSRALPLVRPVSRAIPDQSASGDGAYYSAHELIDILFGTYGVLVAAGDVSHASSALDLTRDFNEPGRGRRIFGPLYAVSRGFLDAVAEDLPLATDVEPVAVCTSVVSDGTVVGHLGARTSSEAVVYVPVGPDNRFESSTGREILQTPPEFFRDVGDEPVPSFVRVVYPEPGETITWHILGRSATVGADSPPCRAIYPDRFADNDAAPRCEGQEATVYVLDEFVVGGPDAGQPYTGTLRGTAGADVMVGTAGDDTLLGLGGGDVLCGLDGDDTLDGGLGTDRIDGGEGSDACYGAIEANCERS